MMWEIQYREGAERLCPHIRRLNFAIGPGCDQGNGAAGISALVCAIVMLLQISSERIRRKGWDLDFNT